MADAAAPENAANRLAVGPVHPRLPDVHRIAVLRGGGLGDLLFAVPAIHALAAAYPGADIVLLGSALHAQLLRDRPTPVGEVVVIPESTMGSADPDDEDLRVCLDRALLEPVDLGVQLHGGGAWSNTVIQQLHPRWSVGSRAADAAPLGRNVAFRYYHNETLRALEVAGAAGARPVLLEAELPLTAADIAAAERVLTGRTGFLVAIHPGARDPRRRWPASRFAEIAARCLSRGWDVVVVGTGAERALLADIAATAHAEACRVRDSATIQVLAGADMSTLCGVLARSRVLVGNDSGPRHLARALGTPTVGVFWIGNVVNAGPLSRSEDRVLISWRDDCPVCGRDITDEFGARCPHDESLVTSVTTEDVDAELRELAAAPPAARAAHPPG
ncbi:glycosyltransferase family 9 protein [Nocardia cyriacigeorgica]|uniref:glycosyltransferase family 9 protein n=1 Tax=Nocardia cyriacigeorgica TaxID=135487 RepID=UPI002458C5CC|nr:glycosyltransferase family 9 protein [Nocardia cyriacigeorgica]BDU06911.1 LPS biosynthesis-related glycosyltransferase [Nocardia cyriacigeorgica]